jgi:hypothetical protein
VIFDSQIWRHDLQRIGSDLARWQTQRRWTVATYANFEHAVMRGFYIVRKLLESQLVRVSNAHNFSLVRFPSLVSGHSHLIWPNLNKRYDFRSPAKSGKNIPFIANQFIHSYVFTPSFDSRTGLLSGVFFASDNESPVHMFWIPVSTIAAIFSAVARGRGLAFRVAPDTNKFMYP